MLSKFFAWIKMMTYWDMGKLVRLGKDKRLEARDMPPLPSDYRIDAQISRYMAVPLTSVRAFVVGTAKALGGMLAISIALMLGIALANFGETFFFKQLLEAITSLDASEGFRAAITEVAPYVLGFAAASMGVSLFIQYYIHALIKGEMLIVNGLNERIYRHALSLSASARQGKSIGDFVNIIGADTDKFAELYGFATELLYVVVATVIVFWFSYELVGESALWGCMITVLLSPLAYYSSKRFMHYDDAIMKKRDERVSLMSQILTGIRVVKYFGWEQHFAEEVDAVRLEEMTLRRRYVLAWVYSSLLWSSSRLLGAILIVALELRAGRDLSAVWVFPLFSIFMMLRHPYSMLSINLSEASSALVSAKRIIDFLRLPARRDYREPLAPMAKGSPEDAAMPRLRPSSVLAFDDVTIRYDSDSPVIQGLSLKLGQSRKIAIVGKVGAGKSSLIAAVLGELPPAQGAIKLAVDAKLGFSDQQSFIQTGTVADNIRFGLPEGGDLDGAIFAAGMTDDLLQFADGKDTEIGENGINLSGGQKQRLSLARVAYADPDLILLDDPLSAVDPDMEDHLAEQLIWGKWRDKTILMASHRLAHLPKFDEVLFLTGNGEWHLGSYDELLSRLPEFRAWVSASERADASRDQHQRKLAATAVQKPAKRAPSGVRAIDDEDRALGDVDMDIYGTYFNKMGGRTPAQRRKVFGTMLAVLAIAASLPPAFDYALSLMVEANAGEMVIPLLGTVPWREDWLVPSLIVFSLVVVVFQSLQEGYWSIRALSAGRDLHDDAFRQVLTAPVQFFDKNPIGRVLNRFSRDVDVVENEMSHNLESATACLALAAIGVIVVGIAMPLSLLTLVPIGIVIYRVQHLFRISAREVKRLYSISRSPRFAHYKETIEGLTTIRAFDKEEEFYDQYAQRFEANQRMLLSMVLLNRWFTVRVPFVGSFYTLFVATVVVYFAAELNLSAAMAGFVLLNCLSIWGNVSLFVRAFKDLESGMTSVERLDTYGQIAAEPEIVGAPCADVADWQQGFRGEISFHDVWLRYEAGLPDVLRGLDFTIEAGQKVGIIGRTGAGKSTVFASLYRFVKPHKGRIAMDGVAINSIPLAALRAQMAIIPQDPTLFRGSLRSNLDRFGSFSDETIWQALAKVDLTDTVQGMTDGLGAQVVENGANLSAGERQLLCLARAILLDTKIIILDEATASVDILTDEKIQKTIRAQFSGKTVLIIAHRLATVADCDLVIELKEGRVHRQMAGANRSERAQPKASLKAYQPTPVV